MFFFSSSLASVFTRSRKLVHLKRKVQILILKTRLKIEEMNAKAGTVFVAVVVTAMLFGSSDALTCYNCTTLTNSNCGDPFNSAGIGTCIGASCFKTTVSGSGQPILVRYCFDQSLDKDACADIKVSGVNAYGCGCMTSYCNHAEASNPTAKLLAVITIASIFITRRLSIF